MFFCRGIGKGKDGGLGMQRGTGNVKLCLLERVISIFAFLLALSFT